MSVAQRHVAQQYAGRGGPSGLADVLEVLLDKGLVIDAYVRVSLIGIELLTVDVRVVVASVDTYLRFAEAVNRLDLTAAGNAKTLGDLASGETQSSRSRRSNGNDRSRSARREGEEDDGEDEREEERLADDQRGEDERGEDERGEDERGEDEREDAGRDQPEDESAQDETDDSDDRTGDGSEHDDPGLLSRIKERGQAFSGRSDH